MLVQQRENSVIAHRCSQWHGTAVQDIDLAALEKDQSAKPGFLHRGFSMCLQGLAVSYTAHLKQRQAAETACSAVSTSTSTIISVKGVLISDTGHADKKRGVLLKNRRVAVKIATKSLAKHKKQQKAPNIPLSGRLDQARFSLCRRHKQARNLKKQERQLTLSISQH